MPRVSQFFSFIAVAGTHQCSLIDVRDGNEMKLKYHIKIIMQLIMLVKTITAAEKH